MQRVAEFAARAAKVNPRINALVSVHSEAELAKQVPSSTQSTTHTPVVFVVKDNFCTLGLPTTCASQILSGYVSPYEATTVRLLREALGGVMLGKTNMDEFAMGTDNSWTQFGQVFNPLYDVPTSPGGSSGGSAAAVSAKLCDVALGTDTGGSVRLPAAYCSVIGLKPTYGRISRYGVVSYAQSLDTVGILAGTMNRVREAFAVLDKPDDMDATCATPELRTKFSKDRLGNRKLRVGVIEETVIGLDPAIRAAWTRTLEFLSSQGHEIYVVSVPSLKYALPTYFAISPAEAASNLARYDGVRYGTRASHDKTQSSVNSMEGVLYGPSRSNGFGPEVRRRILLGTFNTTAEAYEEHFLKAQRVRRVICDELNALFRRPHPLFPPQSADGLGMVDVVVHPTNTHMPPTLGHTTDGNPVEHYLDDVLTVPANLAGIPAVSVPVDRSIGMQVWGQYGDDDLVMDVGELITQQ